MNLAPGDYDPRNMNTAIRQAMAGGLNNIGQVTLRPSLTTTTVAHQSANPKSHISLTPITAHAGAVVGWYISARSLGSFTITHPASANVDQTFTFSVTGGA